MKVARPGRWKRKEAKERNRAVSRRIHRSRLNERHLSDWLKTDLHLNYRGVYLCRRGFNLSVPSIRPKFRILFPFEYNLIRRTRTGGKSDRPSSFNIHDLLSPTSTTFRQTTFPERTLLQERSRYGPFRRSLALSFRIEITRISILSHKHK